MCFAVNTGLSHQNVLAGIRIAGDFPKFNHMITLRVYGLPDRIERQRHTMARAREIAETKWSEIDFENEVLGDSS